jgi:subtilisin family serine protease
MTSVNPVFRIDLLDDEISGQATYNDPLLASFWHLGDATGATKGANVSRVWGDYRGAGVIVAVIDDGVEYSHPELGANYLADLDYDTRDSDSDASPSEAGDRHGTTVSGVVGAVLNNGAGGAGVAPEAGLVGYRIGFGANGTLGQLLDAYQRLTAVDVANNSWGFDGFFGDNFLDPDFAQIGNALDYALDWGAAGWARSSSSPLAMGGLPDRTSITTGSRTTGGRLPLLRRTVPATSPTIRLRVRRCSFRRRAMVSGRPIVSARRVIRAAIMRR